MKKIFLVILLIACPNLVCASEIIKRQYSNFVLWMDCEKRAAAYFSYDIEQSISDADNKESLLFDNSFQRECQQYSLDDYGDPFMKGYMVPLKHMPISTNNETGYIANVLPMHKATHSSWRRTERITRNVMNKYKVLFIAGGAIWSNSNNDHFLNSHGVPTPEAFWKVIWGLTESGNIQINAWMIPNSYIGHSKNLTLFEVSIDKIEKITQVIIPVPDNLKCDSYRTWSGSYVY